MACLDRASLIVVANFSSSVHPKGKLVLYDSLDQFSSFDVLSRGSSQYLKFDSLMLD